MGGGKTFVMSTILALLISSRHDRVPYLISPKALVTQNAKDLYGRSRGFFGQSSHLLTCKRSKEFLSAPVLKWIRYRLEFAQENHEYFVSAAETVQCFQNLWAEVFIELHSVNKEDHYLTTSALELSRILFILRNQSVALIDEVDTIFAPNKELNFPDMTRVNIDIKFAQFAAFIFKYGHSLNRNKREMLQSEYYNDVFPKLLNHSVMLITGDDGDGDVDGNAESWSNFFG